MAVKSIIEIDVQDDAFKAFVALFDKYQTALKKLPGAWNESGKAADGLSFSLSKVGDKIQGNVNLISKQTEEQRKLQRQIEASNRAWAEFGRNTVRIGATIKDISLNILKMGAVSGLFTGAGGLFGMMSLASGAAATRRSAGELGVTSGQLRAANITYERMGNAGSMLETIANIKEDDTRRYLLTEMLGISQRDVEQKSAADLLPDVYSAIQRRYNDPNIVPPGLRGSQAHLEAVGILPFTGSVGTARLIGGTSTQELDQLAGRYRSRTGELTTTDAAGERFATFIEQIKAAGTALETTLQNRLVGLSEPISRLVRAFTNLARSGIESPQFEQGIKSFAEYIEDFGSWVGSEEGKQAFSDFIDNVTEVVAGLGRMAAWLASWFPSRTPSTVGPQAPSSQDNMSRFMDGRRPNSIGNRARAGGYYPGSAEEPQTPIEEAARLSALERAANLPPGILGTIYRLESSSGTDPRSRRPNRAGALGPFQFTPAAARQYGVEDRLDFDQSARGASLFMSDLLRRYNGNLEMALAAYNWGPSRVDRQIAALGANWRTGLPVETQNYLNRAGFSSSPVNVNANTQPGTGVLIRIENNTGGSAVENINAVGAGP